MARVKRGVTAHAKHKKVLKAAKGYYGRRKNTIRIAKQAVEKANQYAFRDRKRRKRTFRALWIQRLNAAVRELRPDLQPIYRRPRQGRGRGRPQGAVRSRHPRAGRVRGDRRQGQGRAGGLTLLAGRLRDGRATGRSLRASQRRGRRVCRHGSQASTSETCHDRHCRTRTARSSTRMVAAAADEAALEAVRVAALGKKGSVSALLKTLGTMSPDERKEQGPLINGLKDRVTAAIAARREALKDAALDARLAAETIDVTLPAARQRRPRPAASIRSAR